MIDHAEIAGTKSQGMIRSSEWIQYTVDDVIDAWADGVDHGRTKAVEDVMAEYLGQVDKTLIEAERMYFDLRSGGFHPQKIFVRINTPAPFHADVLYLMPEEQFVSDEMLSAYSIARTRQKDLGNDFSGSFRFMPLSDITNLTAIRSDGFHFKYERKEEPRITQSSPA